MGAKFLNNSKNSNSSQIYGSQKNVTMESSTSDPAQIYVDKILPQGTCNHYRRLKDFG